MGVVPFDVNLNEGPVVLPELNTFNERRRSYRIATAVH
jgi:hypothetical protein